MIIRLKHIVGVLVLLLVFACRKDKPVKQDDTQINVTAGSGMFIVNEGNFQFGNAKLSYYDFSSKQVKTDLFAPANNRPLGDVAQSMTVFNDKAYIIVNNSGKIEVCDRTNFKSSAIISGLKSPRYLLPVSNNKAYVTDLYANEISIIDLVQNVKTGSIPCVGWTEQMELLYGNVYVTNTYRDYLYVINTATDQLTDSIKVSYGGNSIRQDKNGKLWVLCQGSTTKNLKGALHRINPLTKQVELSLSFSSSNESPFRLTTNATNDTLYYLNTDVYRMDISSNSLPASFISAQGKNFYGLGINKKNGTIFVADAIDYVQQGKIYYYDSKGNLIDTFLAAIIPSEFYFEN